MFQFEDLILVNYGYFPNCSLKDLEQGHTIITGENGAGKSTLVDAFLLALGAKKLTHGRSAAEHVGSRSHHALIIAHVSNPIKQGKNKLRVWEEQAGCKQDIVTIACRLTRNGTNPKRAYLVLDGQNTEADVIESFGKQKALTASRFRDKLSQVGISQETLEMLIIRQDLVQTICDKKPRDLYEFVLRMLGDPQVLKNYEESLNDLIELESEVKRLEDQLYEERRQLKFKMDEYDEWKRYAEAKEKEDKYALYHRAALVQIHYKDLDDADAKYQEASTTMSQQEHILKEAKAGLEEAKTKYAQLVQAATTLKRRYDDAKAQLDLAKKRVYELEPDFITYRTAINNINESPKSHIDTAEKQHEEARGRDKQATDQLEQQRRVVEELSRQRDLLEQGKPKYPDNVASFYDALDSASIEYQVLASLIDPKDIALEDSLGDLRFSILIEEASLDEALKLSRGTKFTGSIWPNGRVDGNTYPSGTVADQAPEWVHDLVKSTQKRRRGYSNKYGYWTKRSNENVLGTRDFQAELSELQPQLLAAQGILQEYEAEAIARSKEFEDAHTLVVKVHERIRNESIRDQYIEAEGKLKTAKEAQSQAQEAFNEVDGEQRTSKTTLSHQETLVRGGEKHVKQAGSLYGKAKADAQKWEDKYHSAQRLIDDASAALPADLLHQAKIGKLSTPERYQDDRDAQQGIMDSFEEEPDSSIVEVVASIKANVAEYEENLKKRDGERRAQIESMGNARRQYIRVVNQLFHDYTKRLKTFESSAGATIETIPPRFTDENTTDEDIRHAEFPIKIGFTGKKPRAIDDQRLSGGQRTLAGLILLMALPAENSDGFFIIDEPYGNLSANRVENVASFIANTPLQIIITLPTNFDPGHYAAGSRIINVLEAQQGSKIAPLPQLGVVGA